MAHTVCKNKFKMIQVIDEACLLRRARRHRRVRGNWGILKAGGEVVVRWLHSVVNVVWRTGVVPKDWRKALVIPVHKKGSRMQCTNYHGISLLSIPGKVYARIPDNRVRCITETQVLEEWKLSG